MAFTVDEDGFQQEIKTDNINFIVWSKYLFKGKAAFDQALKDAEDMFYRENEEREREEVHEGGSQL
jgi:hypothetical protein